MRFTRRSASKTGNTTVNLNLTTVHRDTSMGAGKNKNRLIRAWDGARGEMCQKIKPATRSSQNKAPVDFTQVGETRSKSPTRISPRLRRTNFGFYILRTQKNIYTMFFETRKMYMLGSSFVKTKGLPQPTPRANFQTCLKVSLFVKTLP